MNEIISVIIPVYNVEKYIRKCLDSIIGQTYKNLEIILVDDGSKDNSGKICDEYSMRDNRIKVIHKENGGLVSARKAAMKIASGKYIGYIDSDDYAELDMYEKMYTELKNNNADVIITGHIEETENDYAEKLNYVKSGLYTGKDREYIYKHMLYEPSIGHWGLSPACWDKLLKRELVYDLQMNVDEMIWDGEDHAFIYSAILRAERIVISDYTPYHHLIRENSVATGYDEMAFERLNHLMQHCKKNFEKSGYWDLLKKQFPYQMR